MKRAITASEYKVEDLYPERVRWHVRSLLDGQFGAVLKDLRALPLNEPNEVEVMRNTHQYLCQYYVNDSDDPDRREILGRIGRQAMTWVRRNAEYLTTDDRPYEKRSTTIRLLGELFDGDMDGVLLKQIDRLSESEPYGRAFFERLDVIFDLIWTTLEMNESEAEKMIGYISESGNELAGRTIVGALFLGAMEYFDITKLRVLQTFLEGEYPRGVKGNALASLLILGRRHQEELNMFYPEFVKEMEDLLVRPDIAPEVLPALKIIFTAYKTTDNHKVFKEKILPELSNISEKLRQVMGGDLQERLSKLQDIEPDKMEEIERLMRESTGSKFSIMNDSEQDIVYHMITELKAFPFFQKVSHWFLPYDARFPGIDPNNATALEKLAPILFQGRKIISSDMYSYAFVNAWQNVEENILVQMEGMPIPEPTPKATQMAEVVEDFVFGAYRFYSLSTHARGLVDPFRESPYLPDGAFLQKKGMLSEEGLHQLASLFVKYQYYRHAGWTYERMLSDHQSSSAEVWRGMAVASMMRGEHERALGQLQKAVALEGKRAITTRKIADLLVILGRKEDAIKWLEEGEKELPEEEGLLAYERAKLLYESDRLDEALQAAFKANFLADGTNDKVTVSLSMILLKLDRAEEALSTLGNAEEERGARKLMRGIALLAIGQKSQGIKILQEWVSTGAEGYSLECALELLTPYGYESWEQALLQDIVLNLRNDETL